MPSVFITGANRGIGLALARHYAKAGYEVHATARQPDKADDLHGVEGVTVHALDVSDRTAIDKLAAQLARPFDVVICNAGVMGARKDGQQDFGTLDYDEWEKAMQVNCYGTLRTAEAFTPHVKKGGQKKLVAITSQMGSIGDASEGAIIYRTSKTALNMAMVAAGRPLEREGIACAVIHPGWVQTDMGGPNAKITTDESAAGIASVIDGLTPSGNTPFLTYAGKTLPW